MDKILVIDNSVPVQRLLRRTFVSTGYCVMAASDGDAGLALFRTEMPQVVILEPHIPGLVGEDLCRQIRRESPNVPILVLSNAKAEVDKVVLLELGADDYITKPFSARELLARVRAALRRINQSQSACNETLSFGDVRVNFLSMEVSRKGTAVQLTPQEFKVLRFFTTNAGRVISDHELLQQAWENRAHPGTRTIATHILRLRKKLEDQPTRPRHIRTVHGFGYKFMM
jgi:two-component system, OmpR family, alkaline phosphatase synthesis response regulator PhoP